MQKRRIYDITNVLEGVDLIEKTLKNMIRWKWVFACFCFESIFIVILDFYSWNKYIRRGFDMSKPKEKERQIFALKVRCANSLYDFCQLFFSAYIGSLINRDMVFLFLALYSVYKYPQKNAQLRRIISD